uniref:Uncharacterized protein K02A2.6-like n=1 Tax=Saccoglossus kowalevskii TaxID=10224 RepID=A0ABM0MGW3_SACKO|nr:PREDICTED: uncharacterized protein K02A2.6-like [Saccoglossus kowalevskii]
MSNLPVSDEKLQIIKDETTKDVSLKHLTSVLMNGWPKNKSQLHVSIKEYWKHQDELTIMDEVIFKGERILIPHSLRQEMLKLVHIGHMGIEKSKQRARDILFWPNMNTQIVDMVSKCSICLEYRKSNQKEPMIPTPIPDGPWQTVATDLFMLDNTNYVVVADYYSKFFEVMKLENTRSSTVVNYTKSIFSRHEVPFEVRSDNGPQYTATEYQQFAKECGFKLVTTSPYMSQSNGLAKRTVQTIKNLLKKARDDGKDPYLSILEYRNTPINDIGSPAQILMSRRLRSTLLTTQMHLKPNVIEPSTLKEKLKVRQDQQKMVYDRHAKPLPSLSKGETIRVQQGGRWVTAKVSGHAKTPRSYNIETADGKHYRRNRRHLMQTNEQHYFVDDSDTEEETEVIPTRPINERTTVTAATVPNNAPVPEVKTTRSGRVVRKPDRYQSSV